MVMWYCTDCCKVSWLSWIMFPLNNTSQQYNMQMVNLPELYFRYKYFKICSMFISLYSSIGNSCVEWGRPLWMPKKPPQSPTRALYPHAWSWWPAVSETTSGASEFGKLKLIEETHNFGSYCQASQVQIKKQTKKRKKAIKPWSQR